jgi:uncharacterized membrane protein
MIALPRRLNMAPVTISRQLLLRALLIGGLAAGNTIVLAQQHHRGGDGRMSPEERQRLRDDMNSARQDMNRGGQPPHGRPQLPPAQGGRMSPEEREKMRRDMMDANRGMKNR